MSQEITAVFNLLGGLTGFFAIAVVFIKGGEMKRQQEVDTRRIDVLEEHGSPTLMALVSENRAEHGALREAFQNEQRRTDDRIFQVVDLSKKILEQNTEVVRHCDGLIALIKIQQTQNR